MLQTRVTPRSVVLEDYTNLLQSENLKVLQTLYKNSLRWNTISNIH